MEHTVVGIDVGSSKVCALVAEVGALSPSPPSGGMKAGGVRIVGVGLVPSRGLRKGIVVNVAEATAAITAAVQKAERTSGYDIERAYVGLSGTHVSSLNSRGVVAIARREQGILPDDVDRALEAAQAIAVPHNQELVHIIPRSYIVDGQGGVRDPVGMHGFRLEVEAHIVTAASTSLQNLVKCVEAADVTVDEVVLNSLAAGNAVLTDTEREMGVVLADIGGGTADIAIFIDGAVWHTVVLGMGGEYITNDIAIGLRLPPTVAEEVKVQHGHARPARIGPEERFTVTPFGEGPPQVVPRWKLAEIVEARAEEILSLILQEIKRLGYDGLLPAGVVLCGGTAQLPGMQELAREVLGLPVRIGAPQDLHGLVDTVANPANAVGAGLVEWALTAAGRSRPQRRGPGWGQRILEWLRAFLPG